MENRRVLSGELAAFFEKHLRFPATVGPPFLPEGDRSQHRMESGLKRRPTPLFGRGIWARRPQECEGVCRNPARRAPRLGAPRCGAGLPRTSLGKQHGCPSAGQKCGRTAAIGNWPGRRCSQRPRGGGVTDLISGTRRWVTLEPPERALVW